MVLEDLRIFLLEDPQFFQGWLPEDVESFDAGIFLDKPIPPLFLSCACESFFECAWAVGGVVHSIVEEILKEERGGVWRVNWCSWFSWCSRVT